MFNDYPLLNLKSVEDKIIRSINKIEKYENKKKIFEFVFKISFIEINNINLYDNLFRICAFSGSLFFFYDNLNLIELYNIYNKGTKINELKLYMFDKSYFGMKENIHPYLPKNQKKQTLRGLINNNIYKASDVFVYAIYELKN